MTALDRYLTREDPGCPMLETDECLQREDCDGCTLVADAMDREADTTLWWAEYYCDRLNAVNNGGDSVTPLLTEMARALVLLMERADPKFHPLNIEPLIQAIALYGQEATDA